MANDDGNIPRDPSGAGARLDRRGLIKTGALAGAAAWIAPQVVSMSTAAAGSGTPPTNLAFAAGAGAASQSSTFDGSSIASRANDGVTFPNTYPTNVAITAASNTAQAAGPGSVPPGSQWWNVDLGGSHSLSSITVTNRDAATGIPERSQNLAVYVDGSLVGTIPGTVGTWQTASMPLAVTGQNVTVVNGTGVGTPNPTYLQLAEVEVYGI